MIVQYLLQIAVVMINFVFSWLPSVDKLPTILGIDTDYQLEYYIGMIYRLSDSFWLIGDIIVVFIILIGYFVKKRTLRFFFGARY